MRTARRLFPAAYLTAATLAGWTLRALIACGY